MANALTRKLQTFGLLDRQDLDALEQLCGNVHDRAAGDDLIREGERPEQVFLLLEGWGFRYKLMPDGARQIMAYLIPGDLCDIHIFVLKAMDHALGLLSPAKVAYIKPDLLLEVMDRHPRLQRALWWATLVDEAVLREWLVNMGQREAYERIAHLLTEMWLRMRAVGLASGDSLSLPLTQRELGDTMGLTPVSVNRALQRLRADGLISLEQKRLTIHDTRGLMRVSGFEPNYLHLGAETDDGAPRPTRDGNRLGPA